VSLLGLFFGVRGEISRTQFWFVILAATAAAVAALMYIQQREAGRDAYVLVCLLYLWAISTALIKRFRNLGLTMADLFLFLLAAFLAAAGIALVFQVPEVIGTLRDWDYTPRAATGGQVALWAVLGWMTLLLFMAGFVSGTNLFDRYKPVVAKRRGIRIFLLVMSGLALCFLVFARS
jgi:uncharacterized membrane protein YhaH (DUF805 family)